MLSRGKIKDFATFYLIAKNKIKLKLWSVDYAKGFLHCYIEHVLDLSNDGYNEYAKMIDDLK